ncbi:T9SS type B sorting domain-containing protein [Gaetbulibacter saemankumensis]|uniref:T9SS type B sorting domain-containing protein n=1 Tax=Gaetbulibacter saemankumensis TaxID=311208 RepID=UPI000488C811|nr:choice-of-anchor L domain-containing protein [Gaetbulibacter saemankumensis]
MKHNLQFLLILAICFCSFNATFSQQITIDNSISVQDLVQNNLANDCVEISNIDSPVNGSVDGLTSYGAFNRGNSSFPLESGIIISTGNAASGANTTISTDLSEGSQNWGTDPDIEAALGVSNTLNATVIEFDFVALSDVIQFNYLMASEEYYANYPCNSSDGFAFLIRESTSTGPYQNIARVPGTNDPVTISNIHEEILNICSASNESYFQGYNTGNTNYNGKTTVMTAASAVTPNVQYHVKLIVADQANDPEYDTAVFIEASTFSSLDLGEDINTCSGNVTLNGNINNPEATYAWFQDGVEIIGETSPTLTTSVSGLYQVQISIDGLNCTITDEVNVTIDTELMANYIPPYQLCDDNGDGEETFNLSSKNSDVENAIPNLPANYSINYYELENDARNNPSNNISGPITSASQTIYVRVEDTDMGCLIYGSFELEVNEIPAITQPSTLEVCDNDGTPDSRTEIDLRVKDDEITGGQNNLVVTFHYSSNHAASGFNAIPPPYRNTNTIETLYVRVTNTITGCVNTTTLNIELTNGNTGIVRDTQYIDACDPDHDGFATFDLTSVIDNILNGETNFLPPTYHTSEADAESGTNPIPNPTAYNNTTPEQETIYVRLEDSTTGCYAIIPIEAHTNILLTGTDLSDFALCDEEDSNGFIDFDLITVQGYIANDLPYNISVTYYDNQNDLDNRTNPIDKTALYPVSTTEPKTLYIEIDKGDCTDVSEIILRVNPILLFNPQDPLPYCDTDSDGTTTVYLPSFNDNVTGGNTDFGVRYFASEADAIENLSTLPDNYDVTNSETIWARIEHMETGCRTYNSFDITIIPAPEATAPNPIIICDADSDGFSNVVLENVIDEVVSDRTGLTIEFYASINEAENNQNPLNKNAYNAQTQTLYVRVDNTQCYNIQPLEITVNTLPQIPTITPYKICEDDGNQLEDFILSDKDAEILNGQSGKEVFYFEDSTYTTLIDKNSPYSSSGSQTIYIRVENILDPNCFSTATFTLEVAQNPTYNTNFTDFPPVCQSIQRDYTFDLDSKRQEIAQGSPDDLNINFYLSTSDAINDSNALPDLFTYDALQGQFYVRIENTNNSCVVYDEVRFITFPTPYIASAQIAPVCDTDYDGSYFVDLNTAIFDIENVRFSDVSISFFEDEELNTPIANAQITNYPVTNSKTIYVKAEITQTQCDHVAPLELQINLPPATNNIDTIYICDNDTNTYDLSQVDEMLVDNTNQVSISYYNSQNDASNNINPVGPIYNYTSNLHTLFARVTDNNNGCPIITSFNLQINQNPIANTPPDLVNCDDDFDGYYEFDLDENKDIILGGQDPSQFNVYYYNYDIKNAIEDTNRLSNFHAAVNGETIFVRVENNNSGCYNLTQFRTIVNPLPIIPIDDIEPLCLNDLPLTISAETGNFGDSYLWDNGNTSPENLFNESDLGEHWVQVTTPYDCRYTKFFSLIESEAATINFTTKVDFADPNSITVNISGIGDYVYILDNGEPQQSNVFENVAFGVHQVTIRDLNGCNDVTTEVVVIDVPKFFTPNNDGIFDTWHIVGIEELPGTVVYIHDRYGKLLKTLPVTSRGWDGTFNGANMPSDDYWFVAQVIQDGNAFEVKGHFSLKR